MPAALYQRLVSLPIALLFAAPLLALLGSWLDIDPAALGHLFRTVLPDYLGTSLTILVLVAVGTVVIGVGCAWLVVMTDFPGRRLAEWMLILPLAMPSFVIAYAYTDLLQVSGPVQGLIRELTGWQARDYWFPQIRSVGGAALILTLCLFPYLYLAARAVLVQQCVCILEAGRTLGLNPRAAFLRLGLPLARPGIIAGLALVMMETLADYGAVAYFGIQTLTTGIYSAWFSLGSVATAAQLSSLLLLFIAGLLALEYHARRQRRFFDTSRRMRAIIRRPLNRSAALAAQCWCFLPIVAGFIVPVMVLVRLAAGLEPEWRPDLGAGVMRSALLGAATAVPAVLIAVVLNLDIVGGDSRFARRVRGVVGIGYAVPGAVIAVAILLVLGPLQTMLNGAFDSRLLLTGSVYGVFFAYLVRFLSVSVRTVRAGFEKITPSMAAASVTLGASPAQAFRRVQAPLLAPSLATAFLLVFVDVVKELPATLVLRPFNFDTLAVAAFNFAADERLAEAARPSLLIVAVGLLPIMLLSRMITRPAGRPVVSDRAMAPVSAAAS